MYTKIRWENLLNEKRVRDKYKKKYIKITNDRNMIGDHRNEFERDYDRVMQSSSLRRLQDKAQVFPLQDNDFIRTRLTHSIEVSAIARSFGIWLEKWLIEVKGILNHNAYGKISAMLATAGLVHDIGNPPYGHYGEDVIKNWFANYIDENKMNKKNNYAYNKEMLNLTPEQENDLKHFDGNAQGIRILTKLQFLNDQLGINFTYGTLSVLLKYPWDSSFDYAKKEKKFGYFQADKDIFEEIRKETVNLPNKRNPLTYFLEASDDIAYLGSDVEDGVKKGIVPWEQIFEIDIIKEDNYKIYETYKKDIDRLKLKYEKAKSNEHPDYLLTSVQNFKVWAQGLMISEIKEVFIENYEKIMNGEFEHPDFLRATKNAKLLQKFFKDILKKYCFPNKEAISLELVGDSVISHLLDVFVKECILDTVEYENDSRAKSGKLFRMISENFVFVHLLNDDIDNPRKGKKMQELDTYSKLLLITDFITGMTDSYALDLHKKLKGVKMP